MTSILKSGIGSPVIPNKTLRFCDYLNPLVQQVDRRLHCPVVACAPIGANCSPTGGPPSAPRHIIEPGHILCNINVKYACTINMRTINFFELNQNIQRKTCAYAY